MKFSPAASILTTASPALGWGSGTSSSFMTSGPPGAWIRIAFMGVLLGDRKSTRLNSSHGYISYAVFCVKKKTRLNSSHGYISYAVFCLQKKTPNNYPHQTLTLLLGRVRPYRPPNGALSSAAQ